MEIYDTVISYTLWIIHKIILKGEIEIYSVSDDDVYEVDFMNLVVDKADGLKVVDCDNHFCEFTGVHPSKIKQGKLFLHDIIKPIYREEIMRVLCKKNSPYVYFDAEFVDKDENEVFIHCTGQNYEESSLCRLTLADVSKSQELQLQLRKKAHLRRLFLLCAFLRRRFLCFLCRLLLIQLFCNLVRQLLY